MTEGNRQQSMKSSDNRSSMSPIENGTARAMGAETDAVDDQGTSQEEAAELLQILRDEAFDSSDEALALALGRPPQQVKAWFSGNEPIDDDVVLKARGIAKERGVESILADQRKA
jgi:hypothetical protein